MKVCCIEGCDGPQNAEAVFFDFPTSRLQRKRWISAIDACSKVRPDAVICSRHFSRDDYETVRGKTRLKGRVVPSLLARDHAQTEAYPETSQESTETASTNDTDNYNGKLLNDIGHNDNGNNNRSEDLNSNQSHVDYTIGQIDNKDNISDSGNGLPEVPLEDSVSSGNSDNRSQNNDNGLNNHNDSDNNDNNENKVGDSEKSQIDKKCDDELVSNDSIKVVNDNRGDSSDSGKVDCHSGKVDSVDDSVKIDSENVKNDSGEDNTDSKVASDCDKVVSDICNVISDSSKVLSDSGKAITDIGKVVTDVGKVVSDSGKVVSGCGKVVVDVGKVVSDSGNVKRKTRCKITARRPVNGRRMSSDSSSQDSVSSSPPPEIEGSKDDIEGILTHYYIENKKTERQVAAMTDGLRDDEGRGEDAREERGEVEEAGEEARDQEPVFIELSVGHGSASERAECVMVVESVECCVDPAMVLAARDGDVTVLHDDGDVTVLHDDDDDLLLVDNKKEDPISLLTSSDEDDVIIQEPHIDCVEVSSADTSEDDVPLVKLLKPDKQRQKDLLAKLMWGRTDFYCLYCQHRSKSKEEYSKHVASHSKVLQVCSDCSFTTCSRAQMTRHRKKHRNERRYKCHLCNYSAKHQMSLVYHVKTHSQSFTDVEIAICDTHEPTSKRSRMSGKSGSGLSARSGLSGKSGLNKKRRDEEKKFKCSCGYKTNRSNDLKRHRKSMHKSDDEDDDEYVP